MSGKTVLITGSTDGIGRQAALEMAAMGHHVILHGRDPDKGARTQRALREATGNPNLAYLNADFASLEQVRNLAAALHERHNRLDVLINNAAVYELARQTSADGHELTFAVNVLAPFLLTLSLLDLLKAAAPSRIVNVASTLQASSLDVDTLQATKRYTGYTAYGRSKSCLILFTYALARRLEGTGITVNALHPGVIDTNMQRQTGGRGRPVTEGARTLIHAGFDPDLEGITGRFFVDLQDRESTPVTYDRDLQMRLWEIGESLTGVRFEDAIQSVL